MGSITVITGGQRSGKSSYAMSLALQRSPRPTYLATSRIWDEEHRNRIERHRSDRASGWENLEEEKYLSHVPIAGKVVVIDCVTLWCTNFFFDNDGDVEVSLSQIKSEFDKLTDIDSELILVTNEIGLGGVSENGQQRRFTDMQGWFNQYIARKADSVVMMVSGIAMKIK